MSIIPTSLSPSIIDDGPLNDLRLLKRPAEFREREMPRINPVTFYSQPTGPSDYNRALYHAITGKNPDKKRKVHEYTAGIFNEIVENAPENHNIEYVDLLRKQYETVSVELRLDCPDVLDDYYANVISYKNGLIGVALGMTGYLYPLATRERVELKNDHANSIIRSVELFDENKRVALGDDANSIKIYNNTSLEIEKTIPTQSKVNKIFESNQPKILLTGESSGNVSALDLRLAHPLVWNQPISERGQVVCNIAQSGNKIAIGGG